MADFMNCDPITLLISGPSIKPHRGLGNRAYRQKQSTSRTCGFDTLCRSAPYVQYGLATYSTKHLSMCKGNADSTNLQIGMKYTGASCQRI